MARTRSGDLRALARQRRVRVRRMIAEQSEVWAARYKLSEAEAGIFTALAQGVSRARLLRDKGIAPATLKRHAVNILKKTRDASLMTGVARMLREML